MSGATLSLEAKLDLRAAAPLAAAIIEHKGQDLTLDAGKVDHVGALSVQVMRAAAKTWASDGKSLSIANMSNDFIDQIGLFGFTPETMTKWENGE